MRRYPNVFTLRFPQDDGTKNFEWQLKSDPGLACAALQQELDTGASSAASQPPLTSLNFIGTSVPVPQQAGIQAGQWQQQPIRQTILTLGAKHAPAPSSAASQPIAMIKPPPPQLHPPSVPPEPVCDWGVKEVVQYCHALELGHLAPKIRENGIDGPLLLELSPQDMVAAGFLDLQVKKILGRLPRGVMLKDE